MIFLWDNLTATLISGVALFLVINMQVRVQQSTFEKTTMYSAKKHTLALGDLLERDLDQAGYKTKVGETAILVHETQTGMGVEYTSTFEFIGMGSAAAQTRIRYSTQIVDTASVDGFDIPIFQIIREEQDGIGWKSAGASAPTLTAFRIELLNSNNTPATMAGARNIRVRFENGVFVGLGKDVDDLYMRRLFWQTTIRPFNLSLTSV